MPMDHVERPTLIEKFVVGKELDMTYGPHQHHNQSGHVVGVEPPTWKVDSIIRFIGPQKK